MPSAFSTAKSDPRLPAVARVLALCVEQDLTRPPSGGVVARLCRMPRRTAQEAVKRLVDTGFFPKAA